jgi:hypothetical protein
MILKSISVFFLKILSLFTFFCFKLSITYSRFHICTLYIPKFCLSSTNLWSINHVSINFTTWFYILHLRDFSLRIFVFHGIAHLRFLLSGFQFFELFPHRNFACSEFCLSTFFLGDFTFRSFDFRGINTSLFMLN